MRTLTIRTVPDDVYATLGREAETHHRSLQEEVRLILEKEVRMRRGGFHETARCWRTRLAGRRLGDTVEDIRAGRERR